MPVFPSRVSQVPQLPSLGGAGPDRSLPAQTSVVNYVDQRPVAERGTQLFFVVFEWKDPFIQKVQDVSTACSVNMADSRPGGRCRPLPRASRPCGKQTCPSEVDGSLGGWVEHPWVSPNPTGTAEQGRKQDHPGPQPLSGSWGVRPHRPHTERHWALPVHRGQGVSPQLSLSAEASCVGCPGVPPYPLEMEQRLAAPHRTHCCPW